MRHTCSKLFQMRGAGERPGCSPSPSHSLPGKDEGADATCSAHINIVPLPEWCVSCV